MALSDMCCKCLALAWLRGSVAVVGSGSCRRGSPPGSSTVIVRGACKRQQRARRLEGHLCPEPHTWGPLCTSVSLFCPFLLLPQSRPLSSLTKASVPLCSRSCKPDQATYSQVSRPARPLGLGGQTGLCSNPPAACFRNQRCAGTQPHTFVPVLSGAASCHYGRPECCNREHMASKPEIFTIGPFREKVCQLLTWSMKSRHFLV